MPFCICAAILSTQLIVTVADRVPEFDVGPFCHAYPTGNSLQDCLASEKQAHEKLIESWPRYTAHDKAMCVMEEKNCWSAQLRGMADLPGHQRQCTKPRGVQIWRRQRSWCWRGRRRRPQAERPSAETRTGAAVIVASCQGRSDRRRRRAAIK
jgi:hypothetical protein